MTALGYRDKYSYKKLPITAAIQLTNKVLEVERLVKEYRNEDLHQFLYDLQRGKSL